MLWIISVALIMLWLVGLATGYTAGSYIHILYSVAIVLLVISINQEVVAYRKLSRLSRSGKCRRTV